MYMYVYTYMCIHVYKYYELSLANPESPAHFQIRVWGGKQGATGALFKNDPWRGARGANMFKLDANIV